MTIKTALLSVWMPMAVGITLTAGFVYATVQQTYRQGANDPQIQMAEDAVAAIASGATPQSLISGTHVEMRTSLQPWLTLTDQAGNILGSSMTLDGKTRVPPTGVLTAADEFQGNRVTWQPADGVRSAVVVVPFADGHGYAIAGRSLHEVEVRVAHLSLLVWAYWLGSLVATFAAVIIGVTLTKSKP